MGLVSIYNVVPMRGVLRSLVTIQMCLKPGVSYVCKPYQIKKFYNKDP